MRLSANTLQPRALMVDNDLLELCVLTWFDADEVFKGTRTQAQEFKLLLIGYT